MMKFAVKSAFLFVISLFIFSLATRNVSAATVVNATNPNGWVFQVESADGSGAYVTGVAPVGAGSARLFTGTNGNSSTVLARDAYVGTPLQDITGLVYSTYAITTSGTAVNQAFMYIDIQIPQTAGVFTDTLVFDPNNNQSQTPTVNSWDTWNARAGIWRSSSFGSSVTLDQYITSISQSNDDIVIADFGPGAVRFQVGPASTSDVFDANVDNFTIGINGSDTTYDFEPTVATNNYARQFYAGDQTTTPIAGSSSTVNGTLLPGNSGYRLTNNWGQGSPIPGTVPNDNFSATWEGTFNFDSSEYNFVGTTDNKLKIIVDGEVVVDRTSKGVGIGAKMMTAGVHNVRFEYAHATGASNAIFAFYKINPPMPFAESCLDLTGDGVVNVADQGVLAAVRTNLMDGNLTNDPSAATVMAADFNADSVVNVADQGILASKFNRPCPY